MTLKEFFDLLAANPEVLIFFFIACPLTALLAGWLGQGDGHISPWKYLYTYLVYISCIPGIYAVTLNLYLLLFEGQSVLEMDIWTQILPIASMLLTLYIIRKNVSFDDIPGFGKLNGLIFMIGVLLIIFWLIDRTRILTITVIPFYQVIFGFVLLLILLVVAWRKLVKQTT